MPGRPRGLLAARGDPTGLYTAIALARRHQVAVIDGDGLAYRRLQRDPAGKERRT
jgi:hypothetical protein